MTNPYGPPPGQPYPQQGAPPPPGYGPPSGPMPQQPMPPGYPPQGYPQQPPMPSPPQGYPQQGMPPGPPPGPPSGPMQQMPPQQQFPPPPPGTGRLLIDCSYHWLAFAFALFKPQVTINGQPGPVLTWGKNPIDLPPGQHQVQVHVNYLWKVGNATAVIPVNAGQQLDVFYKAPALAFIDGAIGPTPQQTPGFGLAIGVSVAVFLIVLLAGILPLAM